MRTRGVSWRHQSIEEIQAALTAGDITSVQLTQECMDQVERTRDLNMFVHTMFDMALSQAQASDNRRSLGKTLGPLDGIPIAIKGRSISLNRATSYDDQTHLKHIDG